MRGMRWPRRRGTTRHRFSKLTSTPTQHRSRRWRSPPQRPRGKRHAAARLAVVGAVEALVLFDDNTQVARNFLLVEDGAGGPLALIRVVGRQRHPLAVRVSGVSDTTVRPRDVPTLLLAPVLAILLVLDVVVGPVDVHEPGRPAGRPVLLVRSGAFPGEVPVSCNLRRVLQRVIDVLVAGAGRLRFGNYRGAYTSAVPPASTAAINALGPAALTFMPESSFRPCGGFERPRLSPRRVLQVLWRSLFQSR